MSWGSSRGHRALGSLALLVVGFLLAVAVAPVVPAVACAYDGPPLARVDFDRAHTECRVLPQVSVQPIGSADQSLVAQVSATTSSRSLVATNNGGGLLPPPSVSDSKLQNLVNNLWRGTADSSPVGNGTTADAVRYERNTGQPVGGKFRTIKAQETVNGLRNWLNNNPNASYSDRLVAQSLLDDLLDALNCVP